ncbi:MAG: LysM peptidoglycan-binding domain-containing protein [Stenotrophobium sp.]
MLRQANISALVMSCLLLSACATPAWVPARSPTPSAVLSPSVRATLEMTRDRVADAKKIVPGWTDADEPLLLAQQAAAQGNAPRALEFAQQAQARADLVTEGRFLQLASAALPRLYSYTGLSDAQLQRVRETELAIGRKDGRRAYQLATALEEQVKNRVEHHRVARGESLWTISAREDIYDNPWLWPLIWDANRDTLKNPSSVRAGQLLKIRPNPTIKEVVNAVNFAHEHGGTRINIGEVREVP